MDAAMPGTSALKRTEPETRTRPASLPEGLGRWTCAAACLILLALSLHQAFRVGAELGIVDKVGALLFGPLAWLTAAVSSGLSLVMFLEIVRAYRKRSGFPWFPGLCFAGGAFSCLLALHAIIR